MKQLKSIHPKIFLCLIGLASLCASLEIGCATAKRDLASGNCLNTGKSFGYDNETLIPLCSGVATDESIYCFRDATTVRHLSEAQATEICRPRFNFPIPK